MLIIGNWKAYVEDPKKALLLLEAAKKLVAIRGKGKKLEIVLAPPAPFLGMLSAGNKSKVSIGAQDVSETTGGPQTGEVSVGAVKSIGVRYVILGHSERRARGESEASISIKAQHVLSQGLIPVVCVGESERDAEATYLHVLRAQIAAVLGPLQPDERERVVIAYEPVWAIGKSAAEAITPRDLHEMVLYIRKSLGDLVAQAAISNVRIIYGGSVDEGNIRVLAEDGGVDGFLVGRASTDPKIFTALIEAVR